MANENLAELNSELFKQIKRLNDNDLSPEQLEHEIECICGCFVNISKQTV